METIKSFQIDHTKLTAGIYISRVDGDVVTYDLRMRRPYIEGLMDNSTIHSLEHMFATIVRNSEISEHVLYFGPMGCQTGFYLLVKSAVPSSKVVGTVKDTLLKIMEHNGEVYGKSRKECGNFYNLSLDAAKKESRSYYDKIKDLTDVMEYPV